MLFVNKSQEEPVCCLVSWAEAQENRQFCKSCSIVREKLLHVNGEFVLPEILTYFTSEHSKEVITDFENGKVEWSIRGCVLPALLTLLRSSNG